MMREIAGNLAMIYLDKVWILLTVSLRDGEEDYSCVWSLRTIAQTATLQKNKIRFLTMIGVRNV